MLLNDPEPVEMRGFVDTYWYSANVSRGKIPFARPILFQELELDAVTRDWGQLNFYYAMTHSLSDVRDKVCKRFDIEDDILFTYGYDFDLAGRVLRGWRQRGVEREPLRTPHSCVRSCGNILVLLGLRLVSAACSVYRLESACFGAQLLPEGRDARFYAVQSFAEAGQSPTDARV